MKKKSLHEKLSHWLIRSLILVLGLLVTAPVVEAEGLNRPTIIRHDGYSRDDVAVKVAQQHFSDSNKVILVNREKFPDAISATNISQGRYPVLYTYASHVSENTMAQILSMDLEEVYLLGGELSIQPSVEKQLKEATGVKVTRVAGRSRYEANVAAVKEHFSYANEVVIASGEVYADALYGVSYANTINAPVILTNTSQLEESTVELIKELGAYDATIIGGSLTVTEDVENQLQDLSIYPYRIAGRNRYIGSAQVATASYRKPKHVVMASGEVFSDALVSAPLAQKIDAPILLVQSNRMEDSVKEYLAYNLDAIENMYIQGGPITISNTLLPDYFDHLEKNQEMATGLLDMEKFNAHMLKLINEAREYEGVAPVIYDESLQKGANVRALELFEMQRLGVDGNSHTRPDGTPFYGALQYLPYNPANYLGENAAFTRYSVSEDEEIAAGKKTLEQAVAETFFLMYRRSPGHYSNMVSQHYTGMATSTYLTGEDWRKDNIYNAMIFTSFDPEEEGSFN